MKGYSYDIIRLMFVRLPSSLYLLYVFQPIIPQLKVLEQTTTIKIFISKTFVTFGKFSSFTRLYIHAQVYNVTESCYLHPHIVTYFITGKVATLFMLVLLGFLLKKRFKIFL